MSSRVVLKKKSSSQPGYSHFIIYVDSRKWQFLAKWKENVYKVNLEQTFLKYFKKFQFDQLKVETFIGLMLNALRALNYVLCWNEDDKRQYNFVQESDSSVRICTTQTVKTFG